MQLALQWRYLRKHGDPSAAFGWFVDADPECGLVTVRVERDGGEIVWRDLADTGVGDLDGTWDDFPEDYADLRELGSTLPRIGRASHASHVTRRPDADSSAVPLLVHRGSEPALRASQVERRVAA